jgi:hypothetical protein
VICLLPWTVMTTVALPFSLGNPGNWLLVASVLVVDVDEVLIVEVVSPLVVDVDEVLVVEVPPCCLGLSQPPSTRAPNSKLTTITL